MEWRTCWGEGIARCERPVAEREFQLTVERVCSRLGRDLDSVAARLRKLGSKRVCVDPDHLDGRFGRKAARLRQAVDVDAHLAWCASRAGHLAQSLQQQLRIVRERLKVLPEQRERREAAARVGRNAARAHLHPLGQSDREHHAQSRHPPGRRLDHSDNRCKAVGQYRQRVFGFRKSLESELSGNRRRAARDRWGHARRREDL